MTDETWQQLRDHVERYAVQPLHRRWPESGLPLQLHVDQAVPVNEPVLEPRRVTVNPADYADIRQRLSSAPL